MTDETRVLYEGDRMSVVREGERRIVIRSSAPWYQKAWYAVSALVLGTAVIGSAWWLAVSLVPANVVGIAGSLALLAIVLRPATQAVIGVVQSFNPREAVFDYEAEVCRYRHIPGCERTIPFSKIASVELLKMDNEQVCWLALAEAGKRRRVGLQATIRFVADRRDTLIARLRPLGEATARLLDKPLRIRRGVEPKSLSRV